MPSAVCPVSAHAEKAVPGHEESTGAATRTVSCAPALPVQAVGAHKPYVPAFMARPTPSSGGEVMAEAKPTIAAIEDATPPTTRPRC